MIKEWLVRMKQGYRTIKFPDGAPPVLPERFRGLPAIDRSLCADGCDACEKACPTGAITGGPGGGIDLGYCLFCADCAGQCPRGAIKFTGDYRLSVREREHLVLGPKDQELKLAERLNGEMRSLFGRSLKLRQVSAGGCNACEADVNVLGTIGWDIGRFGIQYAASPRHADGLLITGPVTRNMELALKKTYDAVADPKVVIAVGSCAITGGPYTGHDQALGGAGAVVPVDLYIPGCPPHPLTILDGMLRLLGRLKKEKRV